MCFMLYGVHIHNHLHQQWRGRSLWDASKMDISHRVTGHKTRDVSALITFGLQLKAMLCYRTIYIMWNYSSVFRPMLFLLQAVTHCNGTCKMHGRAYLKSEWNMTSNWYALHHTFLYHWCLSLFLLNHSECEHNPCISAISVWTPCSVCTLQSIYYTDILLCPMKSALAGLYCTLP